MDSGHVCSCQQSFCCCRLSGFHRPRHKTCPNNGRGDAFKFGIFRALLTRWLESAENSPFKERGRVFASEDAVYIFISCCWWRSVHGKRRNRLLMRLPLSVIEILDIFNYDKKDFASDRFFDCYRCGPSHDGIQLRRYRTR